MLGRVRIAIWSLLALYLLAACGSSASPAAPAASRATAVPSAPATAMPATARPAPTALASQPTALASQPTAATQAGGLPEGVTAEGYHVLGNPNAPVTLTMYSDFL